MYTIKEPIDKLFADPLTVSNAPTLVISDTHAPYQNKKLLMTAFSIAKQRNIKQLIHAGDLIDGAAYSTQNKHELSPPIELEVEHARSILYTAKRYFDTIVMLPGNHDKHYTKKEKITFTEFIRTVILDNKYVRSFLITEYDYVYYDTFAVIGHLSSDYDVLSGKVAANIAIKYNRHALVGHDHIHGYIRADNNKLGISIGGMFMHDRFAYKSKSYNTFPHSQLGFVIIEDRHISLFDEDLNEKVIT